MKRKNTMRNALVTSVISMLLCVSMLVGTTFAWFTDEVVSGRNTIAAGNLDIELLADGKEVDSNTVLFDNERLWEPGAVVYENLQIANVGTLALKYQLSLNVFAENSLNGHKLSEVVKVALVDKIEAGATREEVLAKAKASTYYVGELSNFYLTGSLEAGQKGTEQAIVVFWEPTDHDNDYNANNGQKTSDGKPLFIEFGVSLLATQKMSEEDSFGNDYDESASILPKAKVTGLPTRKISTTWGIGGTSEEIEVPFALKFEPNETYAEASVSEYALYHADFVVKADRDVPAESMALGGYYKAFCEGYNGNNWVSLTSSDPITAGTQVRLVEGMGKGAITVSYEAICEYGNDGIGFQCTAIDLTGANAGTTITVELRLYEVPGKGECAEGGGCNHATTKCETGKSYLIGTYSYTFPTKKVADVADLREALANGGETALTGDILVAGNEAASGNYGAIGVNVNGGILDGDGNSLGVNKWGTWDSAISITSGTVKNLTVNKGMRGIFINHNGTAGKVYLENVIIDGTIYTISCDQGTNSGLEAKNCTFNGWTSYAATIGDVKFENCSFGAGQGYNYSRPYAPTEYVNCNFAAGHEIEALAAVTFENCTIDGQPLTTANLATLVVGGIANATVK